VTGSMQQRRDRRTDGTRANDRDLRSDVTQVSVSRIPVTVQSREKWGIDAEPLITGGPAPITAQSRGGFVTVSHGESATTAAGRGCAADG
jgi:hypothetical protein